MKKIFLISALTILFACKKENIQPTPIQPIVTISADSAAAAKAGLSIADYNKVKGILGNLSQQNKDNNITVSNDILSSY